MIMQILKVFDILAIFEEECWLPTDLKLAQPYLPAQQRRRHAGQKTAHHGIRLVEQ